MGSIQWVKRVRGLVDRIADIDFGYPLGDNIIPDPKPTVVVDRALASAGLLSNSQIRAFYLACDGLSLPDVHSGFFIKSVCKLSSTDPQSEPTTIEGRFGGNVNCIGSTGGGGLFVIRTDPQDVLYLPPGPLHNGIYEDTASSARVVGKDFALFLTALLRDIEAFVNGTEDHKYLG